MRCENCNGQRWACYDDGTVPRQCGHCGGTGNEPEDVDVTENEIQDAAMLAASAALNSLEKDLPIRVRTAIYNSIRTDVEMHLRDYEEGVI